MTIDEIKEKVNGQEYEFLKNFVGAGRQLQLRDEYRRQIGCGYQGGVTEQQGRDFAGTGAEGVAYSGIL